MKGLAFNVAISLGVMLNPSVIFAIDEITECADFFKRGRVTT